MNSYVISEKFVGPACLAIVETILGKESRDFISEMRLPNNTIICRITEMSVDINDTFIEKIK